MFLITSDSERYYNGREFYVTDSENTVRNYIDHQNLIHSFRGVTTGPGIYRLFYCETFDAPLSECGSTNFDISNEPDLGIVYKFDTLKCQLVLVVTDCWFNPLTISLDAIKYPSSILLPIYSRDLRKNHISSGNY